MLGKFTIIGIVGTRTRFSDADFILVANEFKRFYKEGETIICSGGCHIGADLFAKKLYERYKIPYLEFPANWEKYGKRAGAIRNHMIAEVSDILIAMVRPESTAKGGSYHSGTEITIDSFKARGKADHLFLL